MSREGPPRLDLALFAAAALALVALPSARGASLVVHPDGSGDYPTIQAAVDAATSGDEVILEDGVFSGPGNIGVLLFLKSVLIRSRSGNPDACIVDCQQEGKGFSFEYAREDGAGLSGLTVTGGLVFEDVGAAVTVCESRVLLRGCVFHHNEAWEAGAVFCQWSTVSIEDCRLSDNTASVYGAGALFASEADVSVSRCTFAGNTAARGSAIEGYNQVSFTVDHSIFWGNGPSPAVNCQMGTTVVFSCTDVYGNPGGDWVGCLEGQWSLRGNFSADPRFCGDGEFRLHADSPCAPPGLTGCGQVGPRGVACGMEHTSWGRLKAKFVR